MSTSLICGFDMQSLGEVFSPGANLAISTSVFRSGASSLKITTSTASQLTFQMRSAGGALKTFAQSFRFYIRMDVTNDGFVTLMNTSGAGTVSGTRLVLNGSGTLAIADGTGAGVNTSSLVFTADSIFHRIDVDVNGTNRTVYVDGVQWASSTTGGTAAQQTSPVIGGGNATVTTIYIDDLIFDDGSIGAPIPGANNKSALLIPTAGNNAGSWTDGAGGTGDIHGSVDNIPPVGVAAATAAAKIKNAVSGTALDYVATMQTYIVAGIPAGSTINAIQAICNDGEEITTGTKSGGIWCASNPAQSAVVVGTGVGFDYGDDTATVVGTFPTGWVTHLGIVAVNPAVTLSTAPTVTVRKGSSTTRVVDVDFMGLYVDYTPPPIGKLLFVNQSLNRASTR